MKQSFRGGGYFYAVLSLFHHHAPKSSICFKLVERITSETSNLKSKSIDGQQKNHFLPEQIFFGNSHQLKTIKPFKANFDIIILFLFLLRKNISWSLMISSQFILISFLQQNTQEILHFFFNISVCKISS